MKNQQRDCINNQKLFTHTQKKSRTRGNHRFSSVQFNTQSCLTLCDPMNRSTSTSLSITNSRSSLKLMSIELVMPSNHLIFCHPLLLLPSIFPASGLLPMSQFFASGGQSIGASASASVSPMNIWD